MQQGSQVVISIRRCQSIFLFNTSINKSDWYCGLLTPPAPGALFLAGWGSVRGRQTLAGKSPQAEPDPTRPFPLPFSPSRGSGTGSSLGAALGAAGEAGGTPSVGSRGLAELN